MTKHTKKSGKKWKNHISCGMGGIPYCRVFSLSGGIICQMILFSNFQRRKFLISMKKKISLGILWPNPISSTLFGDYSLEIYSGLKL